MLFFLICIATVFITFAANVTYHLSLYKFIEPSGKESCDLRTTFYVANGIDDPQINSVLLSSAALRGCRNTCINLNFEIQLNHTLCPMHIDGNLNLPWTFELDIPQDLGNEFRSVIKWSGREDQVITMS